MTSTVDLQAALDEALKWKNVVALPAIEELKNLKIKLDFYLNQEILYKSQIAILHQELASKVSTASPPTPTIDEENDEIKLPDHNPSRSHSHLSQISRADSYIFEKLYSVEYMRESSQSLNLEIENLQKVNQDLQESNENYEYVNNRLRLQQTASNEKIAILHSNVNVLEKERSQIIGGDDEINEAIEKTPLAVAIPACTARKSVDEVENELLFQQTVTFFSPAASDGTATGVLSISRTTSVKAEDISTLFDINDKREILSIKAVAETEGKYMEEIEMVDEKNDYDIEIEGLNEQLIKYKNEFLAMKEKYIRCEKELLNMQLMYDKLHDEMQELNTKNNGFFRKIFC